MSMTETGPTVEIFHEDLDTSGDLADLPAEPPVKPSYSARKSIFSLKSTTSSDDFVPVTSRAHLIDRNGYEYGGTKFHPWVIKNGSVHFLAPHDIRSIFSFAVKNVINTVSQTCHYCMLTEV